MDFTEEERDFYSKLEADSRAQYEVCFFQKELFILCFVFLVCMELQLQYLITSCSFLSLLSKNLIQEYAAAGTVKQNYVNILLMLLRLRQACDHPLLVKPYDSKSLWRSSVDVAKKLPRDKQIYLLSCLEASLAICGICNVYHLSIYLFFM